MSKPDEALRYARERAYEYTNPVYWDAIKNGHADHDWGIPEMAKGYRAGQAASAERIKALEGALRPYAFPNGSDTPLGDEFNRNRARTLLKEADQ